jgi:transposase
MSVQFNLTSSDKHYLLELVKTKSGHSRDLKYVYVLLALNEGRNQEQITEYYHVARTTIWRIKRKYQDSGIDGVFEVNEKKGKPKQYSPKDEKKLLNLSATVPPDGSRFWTVQLLISFLDKNNNLKMMNRETVRLLLKKNKVKLRK